MQNNEQKHENKVQTKKSIKAPLLKIVLIGDSGVGKTTMIHCYISNEKVKEDYKQSVGIDYLVKKVKIQSDLTVRIEIWDTAGNEKFRTMISSYYKGAQGIILLFDSTNLKSFYSLKNWMKEIKQFANENCIKYLVSNKIDIKIEENSLNSSSWTINEDDVEKFAKENNMKYFKGSALNNIGIQDIFDNLIEDIVKSLDDEKLQLRGESVKLGYLNSQYFKGNENASFVDNNFRESNHSDNNNLCCKL